MAFSSRSRGCWTVLLTFIHLFIHFTACDPAIFKSPKSNPSTSSSPTEPGILSDLWSSLTQSGKAPSCPGECVHAITSIFCDHVLEEVSCGQQYLRCCVPSDFSHGTPVQTSPPLGHEIDKIYAITDHPNAHGQNLLIHTYLPANEPAVVAADHLIKSHTNSSAHLHKQPVASSHPPPPLFPDSRPNRKHGNKQTTSATTTANANVTFIAPSVTSTAFPAHDVVSSTMHSSPPTTTIRSPSNAFTTTSTPFTSSSSHAKNSLSIVNTQTNPSQHRLQHGSSTVTSSPFAAAVTQPTSVTSGAGALIVSHDKRKTETAKEPFLASSTLSTTSSPPDTTKPLIHSPTTASSSLSTRQEIISRTPKPAGQSSATRPVMHPDCPGVCVKLQYARFCGNIMSNGICNRSDEACCLQSEISLKESEPLVTNRLKLTNEKSPLLSSAIDFPDDRSKVKANFTVYRYSNGSITSTPAPVMSTTQAKPALTTTSTTTSTSTTTTTTTPPPLLEDCEGTCVAPLFALLCDVTDENKYCPNGGMCCINREPTTTPPPIPTCQGTCIPIFFSGAFCNRPAELIPKTADCMSGTICCAEREKGSSDQDLSEEANAHGDQSSDPEEPPPLFHPPPQINRPVPKPLHPPTHMLYSQAGPFASFPIHSYPQPGMYSQIRPNRPMQMPSFINGPAPMPPHRKPAFGPQPKPLPMLQQKFQKRPPQQMPNNGMDINMNEPLRQQSAPASVLVDPPPMCTGVCITPLLKFTCFGSNVLYPNFACQSPEEICCASVPEVQAFEASLLKNVIPAHFLDVKPVLHPSVVPNFIGTKGQSLGPHLQPHPQPQQLPPSTILQQQQKTQQHLQSKLAAPQLLNQNKHPLQSNSQQVIIPTKAPSGLQPISPPPVRSHQSQLQQPAPSSSLPGKTRTEPINSPDVQIGLPASSPSPATPAAGIHQTQNLPPTESTMSLNSSSIEMVTESPPASGNLSTSSAASNSGTTLSSVTTLITSTPTSSSFPLPAPIPEADATSNSPPLSSRRTSPLSCGIKGTDRDESPRVVGGRDALPGEWCWQVALVNNQNQYLCGGALIGTQWVVTAAHCITNMVRNSEEIYIRVGDHDLQNPKLSPHAQSVKVSTTYIHHNHNGQTLDNDIALLRMESPVDLNESVCLVCLPTRGSSRKPGKVCHVSGYGYTSEVGPMSLKIRAAEVPVVNDQDCTSKINAVTEKLFILPASSFCAGGSDGNDACQGDGGGPLVCETDGFYEITGLVSWGFGCGRPAVPAVYVKVSSFIGWINQIISVNNQ